MTGDEEMIVCFVPLMFGACVDIVLEACRRKEKILVVIYAVILLCI